MSSATAPVIDWPQITVGGRSFTLRYSYAAIYQLTIWGKTLADATAVEIAAAMAGRFMGNVWRSEGFARAIDLADILEPGDEAALIEAVTQAIKKAYPETTVTAQSVPGEMEAANPLS